MIEISHNQAQHLIRQAMDRRLPEEQWSTLQGHLERCAECRAYRQRLADSERSLTHLLRLRWNAARGPAAGLAPRLVKTRERRRQQRKFAGKASWYVLGALLLFGVFSLLRAGSRSEPAPEPQAAEPLPAGEPTATPRPSLVFRGLVAFAATSGGSSEIFLLGAGAGELDLINLTNSPAEETHPAWSPDGEWLAFLSDRGPNGLSTGKNELYVMTIAGSRLTRLTARPDVYWQGPLEWSQDGRWIALIGHRGRPDGPAFLYLIPVSEGGEPRSIAYTRGVLPPVRFSPTLPMLAYIHPDEGLLVFNLDTGWSVALPQSEADAFGLRMLPSPAFDWSLGGRSLVYLADGPYTPAAAGGETPTPRADAFTMVRISPELELRGEEQTSIGSAPSIDRVDGLNQIRAVSWVPNSLQVAGLYDRAGCWTVRLVHAYNQQVPQRSFNDLCVEGGLERSNWTSDGNWLVLLARQPDESSPALYALRVAEETGRPPGAPLFEKLAETDLAGGADAALRVRPLGRSLRINPVEASDPDSFAPPEAAGSLGGQHEWVYFSSLEEGAARIFRSRPDGSQREALTPAGSDSWCPRVGPDGRVAYLNHDRANQNETTGQIFLMDADGGSQVQLSQAVSYEGGYARSFNCPFWSPDGATLAAYMFGRTPGLALLPVDGSPARYLRLSIFQLRDPIYPPMDLNPARWPRAAESSGPDLLWLPNDPADLSRGADRLLLVQPTNGQGARLVEVGVRDAENDDLLQARTRVVFTGWDDVLKLTLSPDGQTLAALTITYNRTQRFTGPTIAQVRLINAATFGMRGGVPLTNVDGRTAAYSSLDWLPDGQLGLVRSTGMFGVHKSLLERIDTRSNQPPFRLERVALFEDLIYDFAASRLQERDGGWLVFATESGFTAQRYQTLLDGGAPLLLDDSPLYDLEVR